MSKKTCDACYESGMVGGIWDMANSIASGKDPAGCGKIECDACSGRGEDDDGDKCRECNGGGKVTCPKCGGSGYID